MIEKEPSSAGMGRPFRDERQAGHDKRVVGREYEPQRGTASEDLRSESLSLFSLHGTCPRVAPKAPPCHSPIAFRRNPQRPGLWRWLVAPSETPPIDPMAAKTNPEARPSPRWTPAPGRTSIRKQPRCPIRHR